jgi:tetratricopeptide (TPR) repeat protein
MGLYNGKFNIEQGLIKNTKLTKEEFINDIKGIRSNELLNFPPDFQRQKSNELKNQIEKSERISKVTSGSFLNGEFITWDFTWNTDYLPITMHYNSSNAPDPSTIESLSSIAYNLWADNYSFLSIQNGSPFTTTQGLVGNDFSVIFWQDPGNTNILAETYTYPNDLETNTFYGANSNIGVDIRFNPNIGTAAWIFNQTPPSSHNTNEVDFIEILTHELGHGLGLQHVANTNSIMYPYYSERTGSVRGQSDSDLAARVYQHTVSPIYISGTIPHRIVLSAIPNHSTNLTGNVTVPNGYTLLVDYGETVNLNNYSVTSTGGTITAESGATINGLKATLSRNGIANNSLFGTIQAAVNAITTNDYGNTYELLIQNGTYSETVNISNIYGLYFHSPGPGSATINGSVNINNCESCNFNTFTAQAISLSGSVVQSLSGINLNIEQGNQSLYVYQCPNLYFSGGDISDRYAYTNDTGFYLNQSSTSTIDGNTSSTFFNHNVRAIVSNGSTVYINNALFCTNTYDLVTSSGGTISASTCWFPGAVPSIQGSGIDPYGNQNLTNCSGLYKRSGNVVISPAADVDSLSNEFVQINNQNFDVAKKIRADIAVNKQFDKGKYRNDYLNVVNNYNGFINKHPGSEYSKTALTSIVQNYKLLDDYEGMNNYLQTILANKNLTPESGLSKKFLIEYYSHKKDFASALNTADEVLSKLNGNKGVAADSELICEVLYAKGCIYSHDLNNKDDAVKCFSDMLNNYPDNSLEVLARNELLSLGTDPEKITKKITTTDNNLEISTNCYPNPFNPSTIINYTLPAAAKVVIRVYDVLGKEVAALVNEVKQAGTYQIQFNANRLSSGVYFYRLEAGNSVITKKLILTK